MMVTVLRGMLCGLFFRLADFFEVINYTIYFGDMLYKARFPWSVFWSGFGADFVRALSSPGKAGFTLRRPTPYVRNRNAQTNLRRYARWGVYTPRVDLGAYTQTSTQYRLRTIPPRWIYFICRV